MQLNFAAKIVRKEESQIANIKNVFYLKNIYLVRKVDQKRLKIIADGVEKDYQCRFAQARNVRFICI